MNDFAEKLIAPDGREFTARSASEYNDLRYGQGYRPAAETEPESESEPMPQPEAVPASRSKGSATPKASAPVDTPDA
jgi:hypothetical protein